MVSSVQVPVPRQRHQTPGATARGQVAEALEDLKQATSVVAGAVRVPWVVLEREEASVHPVIGARRAGAPPRVARAARGLRGAEAAVEEEPPGVAAGAVVAAAVVVAVVGEQKIKRIRTGN